MTLKVYDFRADLGNVVVTPEIRSRFLKFEPGTGGARHSHDLGHEVFLVLDGEAEFEIEGQRAVLGPGQMCVAYADEKHEVRCVGDKPTTLYLSVTPHLEPTHTSWDESGRKKPFLYGSATARERAEAGGPPTDTLALTNQLGGAAQALADVASANAKEQRARAADLRGALGLGDQAAARAAVDAMWASVYATCRAFRAMESVWNELTPAATQR